MVAQIGDTHISIKELQIKVGYEEKDATVSADFSQYIQDKCLEVLSMFPRNNMLNSLVEFSLKLEESGVLKRVFSRPREGFHIDTLVIQPYVSIISPTNLFDIIITRDGSIKSGWVMSTNFTPDFYRYKNDGFLANMKQRSILIGLESYGILKSVSDKVWHNDVDNFYVTTNMTGDIQEKYEPLIIASDIGLPKIQEKAVTDLIRDITSILMEVYGVNPIKYLHSNKSPVSDILLSFYPDINFL